MSWNCSCKQINADALNSCCNCGRKKPKYLGVKIEFGTSELTRDQLSVWYLMIAFDYLKLAKEASKQVAVLVEEKGFPPYKDSNAANLFDELKEAIEKNSYNALKFVDESLKVNPEAQFNDEDNAMQDSKSLKSACFYELGSIEFNSANYAKAIDFFQHSFNVDPNQISIYHLALSTIKLPVEGGGFFSGKKTDEALSNKKKQEIELLRKTIQFGPFSPLGIKAAALLFENYKILLNENDF
jgi:tetratricopeptide (TPR) repeat protein